MFIRNSFRIMDSDPPQQYLDHMDKKRFPAILWSLVNDPRETSVYWDIMGEAVIINQCLLEKEVLSQGCDGLPNTFISFHRQLNIYGFKSVRGSGIKMGCRHFFNPNFQRRRPELVHQMTRNTVKNRLKTVAHQKTHRRPHKDEKFLEGGEGSASPVPLKDTMSVHHSAALPPRGFKADQEVPVYSQHHFSPVSHQERLEYSSGSFSQTGFHQATHSLIQSGLEESTRVPTQGENSQWENGDINLDLVFQMADELMPLPSPNNVRFVVNI